MPVWLFAAYVLVSFALSQQRTYRDYSIDLARQSANVVDGELRDMLARIDDLAQSAVFEEGDLAKVHAEARRLVGGTERIIFLRDFSGKQLLNTQVQLAVRSHPQRPSRQTNWRIFKRRSLGSQAYMRVPPANLVSR